MFVYSLASLKEFYLQIKQQIKNFTYQSFRIIAGIRHNPPKQRMLSFFLGISPDHIIETLAQKE